MGSSPTDTRSLVLGLAVLLGIAGALLLGKAVSGQNYFIVILTLGALFGALFFLTLGERYWYAIPFSLVTKIPALPLGGRAVDLPELIIAGCFGIFVTRIALKRDHLILFRATHIPILLFMGWVCFILWMHPTGFQLLGGGSGGARFYLKIFLGFAAFLVLTSRNITDQDIKWIFVLLVIGTFLSLAFNLFQWFILGQSVSSGAELGTDDPEDFYSWHQLLRHPALIISFLLFAAYKPSQIFSFTHPWRAVVFAFAVLLALFSGKRMAMAQLSMAPIASVFLHRQYRYLTFAILLLGMTALIVIMGQGRVFSLPLTMQRAVSWLPAQWDPELDRLQGGGDDFRAELRYLAVEQIKTNPLVGKGFALDLAKIGSALNFTQGGQRGGLQAAVLPYAMGSAWHNTWLGYAADFGIPLSVFHALLLITVLTVGFVLSRKLPAGSMPCIFCAYVVIETLADIMASHTSGHSANDALNNWWMYGLLFAIAAKYRQDLLQSRKPLPSREPFAAAKPPIASSE